MAAAFPSPDSPPVANGLGRMRFLAPWGALAFLVALNIVLPRFLNDYWLQIVILAGVNVILATSLNLINGITGQFSLGHAGFMAAGAFSSVAFTIYIGKPRLALPDDAIFAVALLVGALVAGLAGFLVGLPSLRLRGDYLAIVTIGFNQIIVSVITNQKSLGGALGLEVPRLGTLLWMLILAAACIWSVCNLARSSFGRQMRAVRDDEIAAEASGIHTTRVKVSAFVISAMWAGVAGALQVHFLGNANPDSFNFIRSVEIVVMVVLGGLGSITGAILAGVSIRFLEALLTEAGNFLWIVPLFTLFFGALSWSRLRKKTAQFALVLGLSALLAAGFYLWGARNLEWLESNKGPLRYVLYSLILVFMMLMRPQGLLGRSEFSFAAVRRFFGRHRRAANNG